jgi:hypothetical protein
MKAWGPTHIGRQPVVVLVTAGLPTECEPSLLSDLAALARTAQETLPSVRTRVIGLNLGTLGHALDPIAEAGGTEEAVLIESADFGARFQEALLRLPLLPGDCSLDLPRPEPPHFALDPSQIDVRFTPEATGVTEHLPQLNGLGECDARRVDGWYYDSLASPTKVVVCPRICSMLDIGALELTAGCTAGMPLP